MIASKSCFVFKKNQNISIVLIPISGKLKIGIEIMTLSLRI